MESLTSFHSLTCMLLGIINNLSKPKKYNINYHLMIFLIFFEKIEEKKLY